MAVRLSARLSTCLRAIARRAIEEHATPSEIGWAVGIGVFVGCTPAIGFHAGIALALATFLRLNRLWAFLGSRVSTLAVLPWIVLAEIEVAHRLRTGEWIGLARETILRDARGLLVDWLLGTVIVGWVLASVVGILAWAVSRRRELRRKAVSSALPSS